MTANDEHESWLPNLVGGVSIWKLAPDLNEEQFFDGRLLVPDTEGSDSLPVRVTWDLTGLVPLTDARRDHPERVQKAVEAFLQCLARTAAVFEKGGSGYDRYKQAFTVPALDADGGAHYFFDPKKEKLCVINWGASPRKIKHAKEYLFGYQDFGLLIAKEESAARAAGTSGAAKGAAAAPGDVAGAAAVVAAGADGAAPTGGAAKTDEQKKKEAEEKKKKEEEGKKQKSLWWVWLLILLGVIGLIALLVLWRQCNEGGALGRDGGVDASAEEGGVDAGEQPIYGHATDDGGPTATDMGHADGDVLGADAGAADADTVDGSASDGGAVDAAAMDGDISDASSGTDEEDDDAATRGDGGRRRDAGRSRDAGRGRDAGRRGSGGGGSGGGGSGSGGGGSGSGGGGSGSGGGGGGGPPTGEDGQPIYGEQRDEDGDVIYWIPGEGGQPISLPHREHYHPDAVQWRIVGGTSRVYDYSGTGPTFHVYLRPGESFDGVRVQWRDGAGGWHDH